MAVWLERSAGCALIGAAGRAPLAIIGIAMSDRSGRGRLHHGS